ncbi:Ldh family oxidoreductase [Sporomusa sp.]|uniref:Ldh family oxidoreductase n=1 Tax=Sporomusa sp. TaxID=2078658 RepID=UPI002CDAB98E|nr:Ldh family oxidoreductase [Sporomusa sp.]HWR09470.1 Ldh family oxidoreductase [Sporomusa sp.]
MNVTIDNETATISPQDLKTVVAKLLEKVGVPQSQAERTADVMVNTDLKGMESHGVRWLDIYLKRIQSGCVNPVTDLKVVQEKAGLILLDAQSGLGQVALSKAVAMGIEKARTAGVCAVAVRNSNHCGALGYYTEMATKASMAAIVMTNGTPLMAPWGGVTPCIGTNPISFAVPSQGDPVILDMATSASARGKVFVAAQKGTKLPDGIALNKEGEPTTDPKEALEGLLLPVGGPKGYGLSLIIDIMAGIMTGSNHGQNITSLYGDLEHAQNIGHFAVIVNVDDFLPLDDFFTGMQQSRTELKGSKLAKGFSQVFLPGEIEANTAKYRAEQGVAIPVATWNTLQEWSKKLNVQ